jgi:hypothetical protein
MGRHILLLQGTVQFRDEELPVRRHREGIETVPDRTSAGNVTIGYIELKSSIGPPVLFWWEYGKENQRQDVP